MTTHSSNDPMHGVTLEAVVLALVDRYGWAELANRININCFKSDPSVKSSLKFLRRTPWARKEVEDLYIASLESKPAGKVDAAPVQRSAPVPEHNSSPEPDILTEDPWANWKKKDQ
ncbi:VF530 family DNA-binding protein [Erwinia sp.]|uniref:VF530 family protein n=1 Tax=Erwinia citreus TaxID=558 RepID=UPI003C72491D